MHKFFYFFLFLISYGHIIAQKIPQIQMPPIDNETLRAKELERRATNEIPAFAENILVQISTNTHGNWTIEDNIATWQLSIYSPTAYSLNLGFTKFKMPSKGKLWLMSQDRKQVLGPYTAVDNESHEEFWSPIVQGDELLVEVTVPVEEKEQLELVIGYVNHDFMNFGKSLSQGCHLDVVCGIENGFPEVDGIRDVIQSVATYSLNGSRVCTGFLVNNTRQDCTPYFMTARHCGVNVVNAASIVTYWNFENSECRRIEDFQNRFRGDGRLEVSNSGARFLMGSDKSDITLVELDDPVVEQANAFFSGWNLEFNAPSNTFCIHHPSGEEKRVSFSSATTFIGDLDPELYPGLIRNPIIVPNWDIGSTEGGSSGAPLFNEERLALGVVNGGLASCSNQEFDAFGPIALAWEGATEPSEELRYWLDPDNFGLKQLSGRWQSDCSSRLVPNTHNQLVCEDELASYQIALNSSLTEQTQFSQVGLPTSVALSVTREEEAILVSLSNLSVLKDSSLVWEFIAQDSNLTTSVLLKLTVVDNDTPIPILNAPTSDAIDINVFPFFNWSAGIESSLFDFQLATDVDFTNVIIDSINLTTTSISSPELSSDETYYWRVRASTKCSESDWSVASKFTTATCATFIAENLPVTISDGAPDDYQSNLFINTTGNVVDVDVIGLQGKHSWISDLQFSIQSPTGTSVQLLNRPCADERDFNLSFDDEALSKNIPCPLTDGRTYQPINPLATLQGEPLQGNWMLNIRDNENADGGALENWGLRVCYTSKTTSLNDVQIQALEVYPNPTSGKIFLTLDHLSATSQIRVMDTQGKIVFSSNVTTNELDLSHLPNGLYAVQLIDNSKIWSATIVVE